MPNKHSLFIADLHLSAAKPKLTELFLRFLETEAINADALYILGDLFEIWAGDDDKSAFNENIKMALKNLTQKGVPVYLMPGNRDFILGKTFAKESNCILLNDPCAITLYGTKIVLTHGDLLCTKDQAMMWFRRFTRNTLSRKIFLLLPLRFRNKLAHYIHAKSTQNKKTKDMKVMDVDPNAVIKLLASHQAKLLIHGHTHKPGRYDQRIVLDEWTDEAGNYLQYSATGESVLATINNSIK
jgi:UDP-2,3-diacylglucosamine hydrolase